MSKKHAINELKNIIAAWEKLPGNKQYIAAEVQQWLVNHMKPAIDKAREFINQPTNEDFKTRLLEAIQTGKHTDYSYQGLESGEIEVNWFDEEEALEAVMKLLN